MPGETRWKRGYTAAEQSNIHYARSVCVYKCVCGQEKANKLKFCTESMLG